MITGGFMELGTLSLIELKRLRTKVDSEIAKRENQGKRSLLKRIQEMAAKEGLTLADVIGPIPGSEVSTARKAPAKEKAKPKKASAPVVAKYANPDDATQTWSGRGRKPAWATAWLAAGKTLAELSIQR